MQDEQNGTEDPERAALLALIERYHGNVSEMATALGMSRQGLSHKIDRLDLGEEADRARAGAGVKGPRPSLDSSSADPEADRAAVVAALVEHGGYRTAAAALGISPRTMARRMRRLGVDADQVTMARQRAGK